MRRETKHVERLPECKDAVHGVSTYGASNQRLVKTLYIAPLQNRKKILNIGNIRIWPHFQKIRFPFPVFRKIHAFRTPQNNYPFTLSPI